MRGHWQSQTRKLNRHYQSGGGNGGLTKWNPLAGCLYKVTKGGVAYYPAPSYCVLNNGVMVQEVFYNRQYSPSVVSGIDISDEQVLEYVPYFPKTSDNYYIGVGLQNVTWEAEQAFDVNVYKDAQGGHEVIVHFEQGEDLSSKSAHLLKLTYSNYTLKKTGTTHITGSEFHQIIQDLAQHYGNATIDGRGSYTGESAATGFLNGDMTGTFSATSSSMVNFYKDFVRNNSVYNASTSIQAFKYPAMTVQPQYLQNRFWSGPQKVSGMEAMAIAPYIKLDLNGYDSDSMHGFAVGNASTYAPNNTYDMTENACFCTFQILTKVEGITCPITG